MSLSLLTWVNKKVLQLQLHYIYNFSQNNLVHSYFHLSFTSIAKTHSGIFNNFHIQEILQVLAQPRQPQPFQMLYDKRNFFFF